MISERASLLAIIYGYVGANLVSAACELGIFDAPADEELESRDLAARLGCDAPSLKRMMKAMASLGLAAWTPPSRFRATAMGALLRKGAPDSLHSVVETGFAALARDKAWGRLAEAVRAGEVAFDLASGESFFAYLERHPEYEKTFYGGMESTLVAIFSALRLIDFSPFRTVLDIGGRDGKLLRALRQKDPGIAASPMTARPRSISCSERERGIADSREIRFVAGDFFTSIPRDFDRYLLSRVISDCGDGAAKKCLATFIARSTPRPGCSSSSLLSSPTIPSPRAVADMNMLIHTGGGKRSPEEIADLVEAAGLTVARTYRPPSGRLMAFECALA